MTGHMDPFVTVENLSVKPRTKVRTKVLQDAGKEPKWNEIVEIQIASKND